MSDKKNIKISLVSPVYNNSAFIEPFVASCNDALSEISKDYEMVLVNDASVDDTQSQLEQLKRKYPQLKIINLKENVGQHIATSIALKKATGEFIFMMDSDMQVHPSNIKKLYEKALSEESWDVISGSRAKRSSSFIRSAGSYFVTKLINTICRTNLVDVGSTFKLFRRPVLDRIFSYGHLIQNLPLLIAYIQLRQFEVSIDYNVDNGKSGYRFSDLVNALILALLNYTSGSKSIVFLLSIGCSSFLFSIIVGVSLITRGILVQAPLPTNMLIFAVAIGLFGMQMNMLGLIAYKLERMNKNLEFRKNFKELESVDFEE